MYVKRHADRLRGSAADRKDMYFQNRVTAERAATNILGPPVRASAVESAGLDAELADFRRREGPGAGTTGRLHGALATLGQGDHAGADVVQMGHKALLVDVGALSPATELDARRPFPQGPQLEGLVLDDYFVVRRLSGCKDGVATTTDDLELLDGVLRQYEALDLAGAPEKQVRGASPVTLVGAEVDSSSRLLACGYLPVGPPHVPEACAR